MGEMKPMSSSMQYGKQTKLLSEYIAKVKQGKRAMIMGVDYIVMSRNIYESWYEKMKVEGFEVGHFDDLIDLEAEADEINREIAEERKKEYLDTLKTNMPRME